jgi:hypothetical protein
MGDYIKTSKHDELTKQKQDQFARETGQPGYDRPLPTPETEKSKSREVTDKRKDQPKTNKHDEITKQKQDQRAKEDGEERKEGQSVGYSPSPDQVDPNDPSKPRPDMNPHVGGSGNVPDTN